MTVPMFLIIYHVSLCAFEIAGHKLITNLLLVLIRFTLEADSKEGYRTCGGEEDAKEEPICE